VATSSEHDQTRSGGQRRLHVAVLGLGEAGGAIAADLAASGAEVRAWDPVVEEPPSGVRMAPSGEAAVTGASAVLSVNTAAAALELARELRPALGAGQLYADLNTASPALKAEIAATVRPSGALFADVALMGPVPGRGLRTPSVVSGDGASLFAELFAPRGMPVELVEGGPGAAAARKLLRSVFMKGLAAAAIESLAAAREAGHEEWLHDQLGATLAEADSALLERLLSSSRRHAGRRVHEMESARTMLAELGVEPRVCAAALEWLRDLQQEAGE
jgi:3-hydroxyisobutyrate dehydrogenase-like beta-hydroxyacid dehydrogenase